MVESLPARVARQIRRVWSKPRWRGALLGLLCGAACWALHGTDSVRVLEEWTQDTYFIVRGTRPSRADVLIVGFDEASLRALKKPLMFSSPEVAQVVQYLAGEGAAAIGIDLLLPESEETLDDLMPGQPGDVEALGRVVSQTKNVVLPEFLLPGQRPVLPIYEWRSAASPDWADLGFVNLTIDADAFARRQLLRSHDDVGNALPCFALSLVGKARGLSQDGLVSHPLSLDGEPLVVDNDERLRINYVGPPGTIDWLPFHDVLEASRTGRRLSRDLDGTIVVLGVTTDIDPDRHATPYLNQSLVRLLQAYWSQEQPGLMSGAEIHANVVATLVDRAFITTPRWLAAPWILLVTGATLGAVLARLNLGAGAVLTLAHHLGWRCACLAAFCGCSWRVATVAPLLLGLVMFGVTFASRWRWMRRMLGMVKSEAIARALEADPSRLELIGEQREVSILFSDIRNFTPFSEKHAPRQVVQLLNEYFSAVVPIIEDHGGTIAQYNGDGVMVIFGAPQQQLDHAIRAVRAALDMVGTVHQLSARWAALDASEFRIGVGVHSGPAVIGAVGSPRRLDYTAHGDIVNTAARIEAGNKELHCEILISRATLNLLPAEEQTRLAPRLTAHALALKGKSLPLEVFSVSCVPPAAEAGGPACQASPVTGEVLS